MTNDHVVLIGIDAYDGGAEASLYGCVNDIDAIQRVLIDRVGIDPSRITRLTSAHTGESHETEVPECQPTLRNIREALERLGGEEVRAGDRVFIYYSGHGTQVQVVTPDGARYVREALVPRDRVVLTRRQYLFDWEINGLLAAIARRTSSVVVVIDACCSTGTTRSSPARSDSKARYLRVDVPHHLPEGHTSPEASSPRGLTSGLLGTVKRCQVVAACLSDERARESQGDDGVRHGELTRALLGELSTVPPESLGTLRWGRIWPGVLARVQRASAAQHPWISGGFARRVFGGPPEDGELGYSVTREGDEYRLNVGSLFGVTRGATLAVYGDEPPVLPAMGSAQERRLRVGEIEVWSATPSFAVAVAVGGPLELPPGARARLLDAGEDAKLRVSVWPRDAVLEGMLGESRLVELVDPSQSSALAVVERGDGAWALTDSVFGTGEGPDEPWLVQVSKKDREHIPALVEHYYWYSLPVRVAKGCQDLPRMLRVSIHDARGASTKSRAEAQELRNFPELPGGETAPYVLEVGEEDDEAAFVCVGVENYADVDLSVALVWCNNGGAVYLLAHRVMIPAGGAHVFWWGDELGSPFPITRTHGHSVCVDHIVALGTTNREASLLHLERPESFEEVMATARRGGFRDVGRKKPRPEVWTSDVTALRLIGR